VFPDHSSVTSVSYEPAWFPSNIFVHRHDGSPAAGLGLGRRDLGKCFRVLEIEGKGGCAVNKWGKSVLGAVVAGLLVLAPIYLAVLLLLKAMRSLGTVVGPLAKLLPGWLPGARVLSLFLVLIVCFLTGLALRTRIGHATWEQIEKSLFQRIPGYPLLRSLTQRLSGESEGRAWRPALAEIEDALVPAFIIEELDDGRITVFVPSVPTPFAGAVYILSQARVHPLNVPFTQAVSVVSRWGSGSKDLVAATKLKKAS
jgi:uncharacterized membrane protein